MGKYIKLKLFFENFTDAFVDIQRQFEIIGKWNWRYFLIRQIFLEVIFSDIFEGIYGKILKWKIMDNFTHMLVDIQKQLEILAKKVEIFSDRTDLFTYNITEKTEENHE